MQSESLAGLIRQNRIDFAMVRILELYLAGLRLRQHP